MLQKQLILFLTALFLSACATKGLTQKKKNATNKPEALSANTEEQNQEQQEKALDSLKKKMKLLTDEAVKSGPEAVEFLGSDLFIKANDASVRGDSRTAAFIFKYLFLLKPKDTYVMKKYSIELIRIGQLEEALPLLVILFEKEKEETIGLILGGVFTALEKKDDARGVYRSILARDDQNEEACVFLAKSYGLDEQYKKANKILTRCEGKSKGKGIFSYYKGKLALLRQKRKKAIAHFKRALLLNPEYYQAVMALGLLYEEKEQFKKAKFVYQRYLKKDPENYPVLSRFVQIKFATKDLTNIIPLVEQLTTLDPSDLNLKVRLGILYSEKSRLEDAIGAFKEILTVVPDSDKVLYYLASIYQQKEEYESAIDFFSKVPESSSLYFDSNLQIAQLLQALAMSMDPQKRTFYSQRFESFIEEKSKIGSELKVELNILLASYFEGRGDVITSIDVVENIKEEKGYTDGHEYYLASLYEKISEFQKSRNLIKKILKRNPNNAHALNFLGYSLLEEEQDYPRAYKYISKAVDLNPEDGYIRDSLGWYFYKIGNYSRALKEIKKAWSLVKTDVVIAKHLAVVYEKLKEYHSAKKYYMEALRNCKLESERAEVLKALEDLEGIRLPASSQK
jgi:tetratricopeptide (TPR) repeat protein